MGSITNTSLEMKAMKMNLEGKLQGWNQLIL